MPKPAKLSLPTNPSDEQIENITLLTIREVFEDSATDLRDLTISGDGTWSATYTANETDFTVEWDGDTFVKQVAGIAAEA